MKKLICSQGNSDTDENNDSHIVFRRNKTDTRFDVDEFSDHNRQYRNQFVYTQEIKSMIDFEGRDNSCEARVVKVNLEESGRNSPHTEERNTRSENSNFPQKPTQSTEKTTKCCKFSQDRLKNSENYKTASEVFSTIHQSSASIYDSTNKRSYECLVDSKSMRNRKCFSPDREANSSTPHFPLVTSK